MAIKSADQITLVDLTDAYSVVLTSESHTFIGNTNGVNATQTATTQVVVMQGDDIIPATVGTISSATGISGVSDGRSPSPTITFTATTALTSGGEITIPVTIGDVTINKKWSYAIAFTGAKGEKGDTGDAGTSVTGVSITYQSGTSNTTAPTGTWESSPPTVAAGNYLWTKIVFSYSDGTSSSPFYSVAKQGETGATGTAGGRWYSGNKITGTATSNTKFSGSGITAAVVGDMYLNTTTYNTYRCTTAGNAATATWVYVNNIKGATGDKGDTGDPGEDALTLTITSSAGNIFKNSTGTTVLTAMLFKGGTQVPSASISTYGTIRWYKDNGSTAVGTGETMTVSAADISNKAVYSARLES